MPGVRAVLFDLDHTLYDRDASFLGWATWFARARLGLSDEAACRAAVARLVERDAGGYRPREQVFGWVRQEYPTLPESVEALVAAFQREHLTHMRLAGETRRLLDGLAAVGLPFGIVTNGSAHQLEKVRVLGLEGRTACVLVSAIHGARKPAPAIFLAAAEHVGVAPPDILFVGDNPEADIVGAAGVGMQTAWLHWGRAWPEGLAASRPDHTLASLGEVARVLARR